jgi:hypothetical protein
MTGYSAGRAKGIGLSSHSRENILQGGFGSAVLEPFKVVSFDQGDASRHSDLFVEWAPIRPGDKIRSMRNGIVQEVLQMLSSVKELRSHSKVVKKESTTFGGKRISSSRERAKALIIAKVLVNGQKSINLEKCRTDAQVQLIGGLPYVVGGLGWKGY